MSKKIFTKKVLLILTIIVLVVFVVVAVYFSLHYSTLLKTKKPKSTPFPAALASSVVINGNGDVRIIGAKVIDITNNIITATGTISNIPVEFIINTNKNTSFFESNATSSKSSITLNSTLIVSGTFEGFDPNFTITAKEIRVFGAPVTFVVQKMPNNATSTSQKTTNNATTTQKKK